MVGCSDAVENTWLFDVGIVVLRSISLVLTPPRVSRPSDSGVTSSKRTSLTSPLRTPRLDGGAHGERPSSGLMPRCGSLPFGELLDQFLDGRHPGRATNEDHLVQIARRQPRILQRRVNGAIVFS